MQPRLLIALWALLCIVACNKNHDVYPNTPCCQIIQLRQGIFEEDSFAIAYNVHGNPISITRGYVGTSSPNFLFRYDKKGRMSDFYGVYTPPNPYFDVWHRYVYDGRNRIIADTTYEFGIVGPGIPLPHTDNAALRVRNISTYQYDGKDRIIKSTDTFGQENNPTIRTYTYNQNDNLSKRFTKRGEDTSTIFYSFDDKVNFRRTHPIWQFLDRDYSVNNTLIASDYNKYGLPHVVDFGSHGFGSFATIPLNFVVINYSCK